MSPKQFWRMTQGKILEGIFAINKPTGISSAQVVRDLQKHFNPSTLFAPWISSENLKRNQESPNQRYRRRQKDVQVKIGHGGTLDPLATGVLIAGVGKGTKKLQTFLECTKVYETIVLFGVSTDSHDREGRVLKRGPHHHITREMVEKALVQFRGKYKQLPPIYSALKMDGMPLYEYARRGMEIPREIEKRAVEVKDLEILEWLEGGTHEHKWPTEEAHEAAKDVVEKLWQREREQKGEVKRKLEENQDDLVRERPASRRKTLGEGNKPVMSGALPEPDAVDAAQEGRLEDLEKSAGPPAAKIRMTVTSGFYVRSFCRDLGEAVGSQAIMAELVRSRQGQFELGKNVFEYSDLAAGETVWGPKVEAMLDAWAADEEKGREHQSPDPVTISEKSTRKEELKVEKGEELKVEEGEELKVEEGEEIKVATA